MFAREMDHLPHMSRFLSAAAVAWSSSHVMSVTVCSNSLDQRAIGESVGCAPLGTKSGLDISAGPVPSCKRRQAKRSSRSYPQCNQVLQRCLSLSDSTGMSRQILNWDSFASFGSLSCTSSAADSLWFPPQHPKLDHQLPPHEISTWKSTLPKSALKNLTPCFQFLAKNAKVCEPLVDTTFEKLGEHEWRNGVQKMNARVNVTSESAVLPLWSDCPPRPSSTGAEPTMFQATWREQAHRARTPLKLTCFAAA